MAVGGVFLQVQVQHSEFSSNNVLEKAYLYREEVGYSGDFVLA
jgi:hypothetical protein